MNILDIAVTFLGLAFLARGVWVGFARQLAFMLALFLGYALAGQYHYLVSPYLEPLFASDRLRFMVAYCIILLVVYLAVMLAGIGLKKVMQVSFLSWFDRLLGGIFGIAKAGFLVLLSYMLLTSFLANTNPLFTRSFLAPYLDKGVEVMLAVVHDEKLRADFLPKPVAIPDDLSLQTVIESGKSLGRNAKEMTKENTLVK